MMSLHDPRGARMHRHCWSKARDLGTCIWTPASSLSWARRLGVVLDVSRRPAPAGSSVALNLIFWAFVQTSVARDKVGSEARPAFSAFTKVVAARLFFTSHPPNLWQDDFRQFWLEPMRLPPAGLLPDLVRALALSCMLVVPQL